MMRLGKGQGWEELKMEKRERKCVRFEGKRGDNSQGEEPVSTQLIQHQPVCHISGAGNV